MAARLWASRVATWAAAPLALALPAALPSWPTEHLALLALSFAALAVALAGWLQRGSEAEGRGLRRAAPDRPPGPRPSELEPPGPARDEDFFARLWSDVEGPGRGRDEAHAGTRRSRADSPAPVAPQEETSAEENLPGLSAEDLPVLAVLNHATCVEDLKILPGIGPKSAAAILAHRQKGGQAFSRLEDLVKVVGLGRPVLRKLQATNI